MSYEATLIQESTGEGGGWSLDRTEATADWFDNFREEEVNSGSDVRVPAEPESFEDWLKLHEDSI